MKSIVSVRFWLGCAACLCISFLYGGFAHHSTAYSEKEILPPAPYEMIYTQEAAVPSTDSYEETDMLKGMIVTEAATKEELRRIAYHIKERYASHHIDCIEVTVHRAGSGMYEELPYEPLSRATIAIAYTPQGKKKLKMPDTDITILLRS